MRLVSVCVGGLSVLVCIWACRGGGGGVGWRQLCVLGDSMNRVLHGLMHFSVTK